MFYSPQKMKFPISHDNLQSFDSYNTLLILLISSYVH